MRARRRPAPAAEGPYASYVDLFVGLIFLFLMIVCILVLEQGIAKAETERRAGAYVKGLAERLTDAGISVEAHGTVLRFPDGILFDTMETELSGSARQRVRVLRRLLIADSLSAAEGCKTDCNPPLDVFEGMVIEGHADGRPYTGGGPVRDNLGLSVLRASSVHRELVGEPVAGRMAHGLDPRFVSAAGFGSARPLPGTVGDEDEPRNRRIEIRFLLRETLNDEP